MNYYEYRFVVSPKDPGEDILAAQLGILGFESFLSEEDSLMAYIPETDWKPEILEELYFLKNPNFTTKFTYKQIEQQNWNEEWEKNFHPIVVNDQCSVRAPFHEIPSTKFDIVIEPKMSFGTGHHETTHMMIEHILKLNVKDKTVLDMGCGTGILAILADMKGAKKVDAIDIDNWCYQNSLENIERNNCQNTSVYEGDSSLLNAQKYDLIIANINRNILLEDIKVYTKVLSGKGILLLSGFYEKDIIIIDECCVKYSLKLTEKLEKNSWVSLKYVN
ncbi:50S ribosomal protein L11 methyltransferase [Ascidiimonas sp. W6]|uniref:50S ribosomal protein L11 methyltransferase n=1 Tax=Ascidiimonas meishanensis TaxID=3128903 RepID=UPI0030EB4A10